MKRHRPWYRTENGKARKLTESEIVAYHVREHKIRRDKAFGGDTARNGPVRKSRGIPEPVSPRPSIAEQYRAAGRA